MHTDLSTIDIETIEGKVQLHAVMTAKMAGENGWGPEASYFRAGRAAEDFAVHLGDGRDEQNRLANQVFLPAFEQEFNAYQEQD